MRALEKVRAAVRVRIANNAVTGKLPHVPQAAVMATNSQQQLGGARPMQNTLAR
jgi:hypothetical protein